MGRAAQVELVSHFNVEQMVRQTNSIYHAILIERRSAKIVKKIPNENNKLVIEN
jgi:hypothetical protein